MNSALPFTSSFPYNPKLRLADFSACYLLHDDFLLGLFFDPEDVGDVFFQNVFEFQRTTWLYTPEDGTLQ
jgi:hypothetical protein